MKRPPLDLTIAVLVGMGIGIEMGVYWDVVVRAACAVLRIEVIPHALVGAACALASYGYYLEHPDKFHTVTALIRTATGALFGPIMAHTGAGIGINHDLQTAAAAIGGVLGPRSIDTAVSIVTGAPRK